jgi:hypothetical protein
VERALALPHWEQQASRKYRKPLVSGGFCYEQTPVRVRRQHRFSWDGSSCQSRAQVLLGTLKGLRSRLGSSQASGKGFVHIGRKQGVLSGHGAKSMHRAPIVAGDGVSASGARYREDRRLSALLLHPRGRKCGFMMPTVYSLPAPAQLSTLPLFHWCATEVETVFTSVSIVKNELPPLTIIMFSLTGAPLNV